jgi:hypothetical protein
MRQKSGSVSARVRYNCYYTHSPMLLSLVPLLLLNLARLAECSRVVNVHVIYTGGKLAPFQINIHFETSD